MTNKKYFLSLAFIAVFNILFAYFIPYNVLPSAIHDDFLFYRLGDSLASGNWLGKYENTTLIKGFFYPAFIGVSVFTHLPLRMLEGILICLSSFYFISFLGFSKVSKNTLLILFGLIVFYPLQYGANDFRLLRDTIYPQLLLCIFTSLFYIVYFLQTSSSNLVKYYFHNVIFVLAIFSFWNTREEGVWILPALSFLVIVLIIISLKFNNFKKLLVLTSFSLLLFGSLDIALKCFNKYYYDYYIATTFKDTNFQSAYGSLHRIDNNKLLYNSVTHDEWNTLFKVSPSVAELKNYINGPGYDSWSKMACEAIKTQGLNINESGCNNEMPVGFLMFSLLDGIWSIGYRTPKQISDFMRKVASEIDFACDSKVIDCRNKPMNMMPPALSGGKIDYSRIFKNFIDSLRTIVNFKNRDIFTYFTSGDFNKIKSINEKIGGFVFPFQNAVTDDSALCLAPSKLMLGTEKPGFIDGIEYKNFGIYVYGWALNSSNNKFTSIEIVSNGSKVCSVTPDVSRPDVLPSNPVNIGFTCIVPINYENNINSSFSAFAIDQKANIKYALNLTENVSLALRYGVKRSPSFSINESIGYLFNISSYLYSFMNKIATLFIPVFLILIIRNNNRLLGGIMLTFCILFISRTSLISILYYLGLAPANPLYLNSASYIYFLMASTSIVFATTMIYDYFIRLIQVRNETRLSD